MFDLYGPNSLKVKSYIEALRKLSSEQLGAIDLREYEVNQIKIIIDKVNSLKDQRLVERANAIKNATEVVKNKALEWHRLLVSNIAVWLVLEDLLGTSNKVFIDLYLINQIIQLSELRTDFKKEDWAIEVFYEQLSKIDGEQVFIDSRPDARGNGGAGLPDFIVYRKGVAYTVEHTSINSYEKQDYYNRLWSMYIKPLQIEKKVTSEYPNKWIDIRLPVNAFNSERTAKKYNFDNFLAKLLSYVGETIAKAPKTYNLGPSFVYDFKKPDFQVHISVGDGYNGCFLIGIAPTSSEQVRSYLNGGIAHSISRKQPKLKRAKEKGENTILLLDSDDTSFVNINILADAFADAIGKIRDILDGIDEVYILHQGGSGLLAPVKLGERIYPNLPEFKEYIFKELGLSLNE